MNPLFGSLRADLVDPNTPIGALSWAVVFIAVAAIVTVTIRRAARRLEPHLSDLTGLRFVTALAHVLVYVIAFVLYAHLVPRLRALGTALLAGVSVVSVVVGLAAQNTLVSLVLYRPIRVGDPLTSPKGLITATLEHASLGYTVLRDVDGHELIVPNGVMVSSVVIRLGQAPAGSEAATGPRT